MKQTLAVLLALGLVLCAAFAAAESDLLAPFAGEWEMTRISSHDDAATLVSTHDFFGGDVTVRIVFTADGTYTQTIFFGTEVYDEETDAFSVTADRITLGRYNTMDYVIDGNEMRLTDSNGHIMLYTRAGTAVPPSPVPAGDNPLLGKWTLTAIGMGGDLTLPVDPASGTASTIEFLADGTYRMATVASGSEDADTGVYEYRGETVLLDGTDTAAVTLADDTLTLVLDGISMTYVRAAQ